MATTESLTLEVHGAADSEAPDALMDLYTNLKSPDRTKSWKGPRLRRSKTYSGSPNMRIGENCQLNSNSDPAVMVPPPPPPPATITSTSKPVPLSPVNQKKWGKTNMKRRSSNATSQRLSRSTVEDCSGSAVKVEVRSSTEISDSAVNHRYSCSCQQYYDRVAGIVYKLQTYTAYTSLPEITPEVIPPTPTATTTDTTFSLPDLSPATALSATTTTTTLLTDGTPTTFTTLDWHPSEPGEREEQSEAPPAPVAPLQMSVMCQSEFTALPPDSGRSSTPIVMEEEGEEGGREDEFNFDFAVLDDTIVDLQSIQREIRDVLERERWSGEAGAGGGCCVLKGSGGTSAQSLLHSVALAGSDSTLYLIVTVFTYLDLGSLLEASRVCRQWHCASLHPAVWKRVNLSKQQITGQVLKSLSRSCVATERLSMAGCAIHNSAEEELRPFFSTMSATLRDLRLDNTDQTNRLLDEALSVCSGISRLHVEAGAAPISEDNLSRLSSYVSNLTCLKLSDLSCINRTNYQEFVHVHCLSCSVRGFRPDELQNLLSWFPSLRNLTLSDGPSLHSNSVRFLASHPDLIRLTFHNTYVTPRALLFILSGCKKLEKLELTYDCTTFSAHLGQQYRENVRRIQENVLFRDVLHVHFTPPAKPPRPSRAVEG